MGVDQTIRQIARGLGKAGIANPMLDARLLVQAATGLTHQDIICQPSFEISPGQMARLEEMAARRRRREPVSRILGYREFHGLEFQISPHVLDPRPDSEVLVQSALAALSQHQRRERMRIVDLGTGSGCLLISLLAELAGAQGTGVDISPDALGCAAQNADRLGVAERASFICGNWLSGLDGPFDLLISNPPYIRSNDLAGLQLEVALHDPVLALDGGGEGLAPYHLIMAGAARVLAPDALVFFEVGLGQAEDVMQLLRGGGVAAPRAFQDLAGINRVVGGRFTGNSS